MHVPLSPFIIPLFNFRDGIEFAEVPRTCKADRGFLSEETFDSFQAKAGTIYQRCKHFSFGSYTHVL